MLSISLRSGTHYLQRSWGEECAVYVIESGETHLLSSAAAFLLERLKAGPVSIETLRDEFLSFSEGLRREEIIPLLDNLIRSMCKIGLIETVENSP